MPLLLMCGLPSSGKSHRASAIASYLSESGREAVVLDDASVCPHFDQNDTYSSAMEEKELRGQFLSAIQRKLSKSRVLIVDSLNYIKGYRYEMYCAAKAAQTTYAVVYCECTSETAASWNENKDRVENEQSYLPETFQNLVDRFEPPDAANRWDSPLFSILPSTSEPPFQEIDAALFKSKPAKPNKATLITPVAPTNVSYDTDKLTQEIITAFLTESGKQQQSKELFLEIRLSSHPTNTIRMRYKNEAGKSASASEADLQRSRRDFISLFRNKTHLQSASSDASNIPKLFVAFLESRLFPELAGDQQIGT